jgi:hypothetical protein
LRKTIQCPMINCYTLMCSSFLNICVAFKKAFKIRWLDSRCDVMFTVTSTMNDALRKAYKCGLCFLLLVFVFWGYILKVHVLVISEHKLYQIWNNCIVTCIY